MSWHSLAPSQLVIQVYLILNSGAQDQVHRGPAGSDDRPAGQPELLRLSPHHVTNPVTSDIHAVRNQKTNSEHCFQASASVERYFFVFIPCFFACSQYEQIHVILEYFVFYELDVWFG